MATACSAGSRSSVRLVRDILLPSSGRQHTPPAVNLYHPDDSYRRSYRAPTISSLVPFCAWFCAARHRPRAQPRITAAVGSHPPLSWAARQAAEPPVGTVERVSTIACRTYRTKAAAAVIGRIITVVIGTGGACCTP